MKISNSKKQLAKIINENGGWRDGAEWSVFGTKSMHVAFISAADGYPSYSPSRKAWPVTPKNVVGEFPGKPFLNWHQTILSRDEYFDLYPAPEQRAKLAEIYKPSIEQLAADYCKAKDYAGRLQQGADAAEAYAEAKLAAYVAAAGSAVGLILSVVAPEPELVITDWRDLQVGDVIKCVGDNTWSTDFEGKEAVVLDVEDPDYDGGLRILADIDGEGDWGRDFKFIRRPTRETNNG